MSVGNFSTDVILNEGHNLKLGKKYFAVLIVISR